MNDYFKLSRLNKIKTIYLIHNNENSKLFIIVILSLFWIIGIINVVIFKIEFK